MALGKAGIPRAVCQTFPPFGFFSLESPILNSGLFLSRIWGDPAYIAVYSPLGKERPDPCLAYLHHPGYFCISSFDIVTNKFKYRRAKQTKSVNKTDQTQKGSEDIIRTKQG